MGKPSESVCHICVGGHVIPVVGPGQVIASPDEDNSRNGIIAFLPEEFWHILLLHFKSEHHLGASLNVLLNHLTSLVIIEVELNVCRVRHLCLE
jgi:hypothetical protein